MDTVGQPLEIVSFPLPRRERRIWQAVLGADEAVHNATNATLG